jgi:outer membrane protein assembly factor BamB
MGLRVLYYLLLVSLLSGHCISLDEKRQQIVKLELNAVLNTITLHGDTIIYSCWDNTIKFYSLKAKRVVFSKSTINLCYSRPILKGGQVYFPVSDKKFISLELKTGKVIWELDLKGRCASFNFIDDSTIVASSKNYGLLVINAVAGKINYEMRYSYAATQLPDLSPWAISWDDHNIYISNWQGHTLSSYKKENGLLNWHYTDDRFGIAGKSIVVNDRLFLGINNEYKNGSILLIAATDGRVINQVKYQYEERVNPILLGKKILFYSYDGCLNQFDTSSFSIVRIKKFEKEFDLSGNQLFLSSNQVYFSDASFFLNAYIVTENKFRQLAKIEKSVLFVFDYGEDLYCIF